MPHLPRKLLSFVRIGLKAGWEQLEMSEKQYPSVYSGELFDLYFKKTDAMRED